MAGFPGGSEYRVAAFLLYSGRFEQILHDLGEVLEDEMGMKVRK